MRHRFWASLALALAVLGAGALGMAGWFLPQRNAALAREGRVPKTEYRLTPPGRSALERYLDHMEAIIHATREG